MNNQLQQPISPIRGPIAYTLISVGFLGFHILLTIFGFQNIAVYVVALCAAGFAILRYPEVGIYTVFILTMLFERFFTLAPLVIGSQSIKVYPLDFVLFITAFAAFIQVASGLRKVRGRFSGMELWIVLFVILSTLFLLRALTGSGVDSSVAISTFKNYAFYSIIYFLFALLINSKEQFTRFLKILYVTGASLIVFIAIGLLRQQGLWTEFTPLSTEGVRYLAFPHAFYLSMCVALFLPVIFFRTGSIFSRMALIWAQLVGVLVSLMRHLWLSLFFGIGVVLILLYQEQRKRFREILQRNVGAVLIIISLLLFVIWSFPFWDGADRLLEVTSPLFNRFNSFGGLQQDISLQWRVFAWEAAREAFVSSPFLGIGFGRNLVLTIGDFQQVVFIRELHNSALVMLVQMGLAGLAFFIAINVSAMTQILKLIRRRGEYYIYALGVLGMYLTYLFASFWQPYFETNLTGIFFWLILAMIRFMYVHEYKLK